jgi:hypothetical protein
VSPLQVRYMRERVPSGGTTAGTGALSVTLGPRPVACKTRCTTQSAVRISVRAFVAASVGSDTVVPRGVAGIETGDSR